MPHNPALAALRAVANSPREHLQQWRADHPGRRVLGVMPMNFPRELAHAAGVHAVVVPDDRQAVTEGRAWLPEFYCGFTRNIADQAAGGRFDVYDALVLADHCIQLLGASDVARELEPSRPVFLGQLISSLSDSDAPVKTAEMMAELRAEVERFAQTSITDEALAHSIATFNAHRALLRQVLDERATGVQRFTAGELVDIMTAAGTMDPSEHTALLTEAIAAAVPRETVPAGHIRVHLSGHLCHAPRPDLLDVLEEVGAVVVDDDLWAGRRYAQTDVDPALAPMYALAAWYASRNTNLPCPTRVQQDVDWDGWLVERARANGTQAVIHLMPKFCEPHMLYYPELRRGLDAVGIPQLLIETEHEGLPSEALRTRVEALVERVHHAVPA